MKKVTTTLLLLFLTIFSFAQEQDESVKPTFGVKLDREVAVAVIEKETYYDVIVELKAAAIDDWFAEGVKITVKDIKTGKKIYKERFENSYLYAYSDGSIMVGKGNALTQLILGKPEEDGFWVMKIRENGIY